MGYSNLKHMTRLSQQVLAVNKYYFSTAATLEMSLDEVQGLHRLQSEFERDPTNVQHAYELFRVSTL